MANVNDFSRACDALLEFEAGFNNMPCSSHSIFSLEIQKEELKALWVKVKDAFDDYSKKVSDDETGQAALRLAKCRYQDCYSAYLTCGALMGETAHNLTFTQQSSSTVNPVNREIEPPARSSIHLPPCDTEIFYGDYMSWPSFRDLFTAIYINNSRLTPVEKLYHLNQKTRGEAKDIVKKSPLTNDGFATAWQNLSDRYENKRIMVNSQLKTLFNLPSVTSERGTEIKNLQRAVNNCISVLEMYGIDIENWDAIFVFLVSSRLPDTTLALWEQGIVRKAEIPKWEELDSFLTSRFQTLETVSDIRSARAVKPVPNRQPAATYERKVSAHHGQFSQPACRLCPEQSHALKGCPKFLAMKVEDRLNLVRKHNLCMNCLAHSHIAKDCKSPFNCWSCHQRHHSLLHRTLAPQKANSSQQRPPPRNKDSRSEQPPAGTSNVQALFAASNRNILLGTAMVNICHSGVNYEARALLDSGSEGTFITERLQRLIKLPTRAVDTQVSGINATVSANVRKVAHLAIGSPINPQFRIEARGLVLPQLTGNLPKFTVDQGHLDSLPPLRLADVNFYRSQQVDLILGADVYPAVIRDKVQRNVLGSLVAQETVFGWILTGPIPPTTTRSFTTSVSYGAETPTPQLTRFWELEEVSTKRKITPEDAFCEELYAKTTTRNEQGRYVVALPFRREFPDEIILGLSRTGAARQFLRSEAGYIRKPELKTEYDRVLKEYIELNHMCPVRKTAQQPAHRPYYLPHHAVVKPDSITTKVRVVFNASCPTSNGVSLNDILYPGPILQADLVCLLLKWRLFKYVFNADIEKMYRQIMLHQEHTPFQRILFRESPDEEIKDYELKTVTFGVNCAPYLAIRTLHQLADDVKTRFPLAAKILKQYMYVDDVLAGAHDCTTAIQMRDEVIEALNKASFPLRKWTSNCKKILAGLPKAHIYKENFLELDDMSETKMLGIRWNAVHDMFHFTVQPIPRKQEYTKREVLSCVAKLFDPAGWLGPIVVVAKIFMQEIWLTKIDWDDSLPRNLLLRWETFLDNYEHIQKIKIPRWTHFTPWDEVEFHGFCDASEKAYAAALYIRVRDRASNNAPHINLLFEVTQPVIYKWTDSTIVLSWLRKPACTWTTKTHPVHKLAASDETDEITSDEVKQ
ncbi:uncharacterized protein LOC118755979, partial [Rhagoletis pomonella]|uniref:uncharacterized protein LOC118755979 n=1 Tax=Rhagoletis pomonella TaxID=28610 RepID=UPI00177C70D1